VVRGMRAAALIWPNEWKNWDDVVPLANQFARVWDALMAAAPLSENNGSGAQQKRNTHSTDLRSWFWLLRIDKFLSGHISCLSRYSHSLIQSGRPLLYVLCSPRREKINSNALEFTQQQQPHGLREHFAVCIAVVLYYMKYQGWYVTNLRLSLNGEPGHKCAAGVKKWHNFTNWYCLAATGWVRNYASSIYFSSPKN
jgi:hypothetical protein